MNMKRNSQMCGRALAALSAVIAVVWLVPVPAASQAQTATRTPPRTLWGGPDLQGVWDFRTITPLERPSGLAGKQVLTDEEAATFEARENRRLNRDLVDLYRTRFLGHTFALRGMA